MRSPNPCGIPVLEIGRDVNGRFRPNNKGGPGNPFARKVAALRKTLLDSVSEQDLKDMIESLKQQARQGDKAAIKLILQYCVGKPASPEDPDRMDIDEWERLQQMRVGPKEFERTTESVPACLACHLAATHWPCNIQDGPLAQDIHHIHSQMKAGAQTAPAQPSAPVVNPNAPTEPTASTATRKSNERGDAVGGTRRSSPSLTQPPLPNGEIEQEPPPPREPRQRLGSPSQPSGQSERKPPKG